MSSAHLTDSQGPFESTPFPSSALAIEEVPGAGVQGAIVLSRLLCLDPAQRSPAGIVKSQLAFFHSARQATGAMPNGAPYPAPH